MKRTTNSFNACVFIHAETLRVNINPLDWNSARPYTHIYHIPLEAEKQSSFYCFCCSYTRTHIQLRTCFIRRNAIDSKYLHKNFEETLIFFCYMTLYGLAHGGMIFFIFCPTSVHKSEIRWNTLKLTFATESKGKRYWLVCLRIFLVYANVMCNVCILLH